MLLAVNCWSYKLAVMLMELNYQRVLRIVFCLLTLALSTGCETHRGLYEAAKVEGWKSYEREGITFFSYPTKSTPKWYVSFYAPRKGELYFQLGTDAWSPDPLYKSLVFLGDTIKIVSQDRSDEKVIPAHDNFVSHYCQTVQVGDSEDFTVILPSFSIGNSVVPQLSARFKWSDRKYYQWVPLQ